VENPRYTNQAFLSRFQPHVKIAGAVAAAVAGG
jgi:hypothetical protein